MLDAVAATDGLTATSFREFEPNRINEVSVKIPGLEDSGSILLTELDPDRVFTDNTTHAFRHSGFGGGIKLDPATITSSVKNSLGNESEVQGVYNNDVSASWF